MRAFNPYKNYSMVQISSPSSFIRGRNGNYHQTATEPQSWDWNPAASDIQAHALHHVSIMG